MSIKNLRLVINMGETKEMIKYQGKVQEVSPFKHRIKIDAKDDGMN